jgi:SrtB family sortase
VLNGSRGVFRSGVGNVFIKELHDRILDHRYIENIKKNNDLNDLTVVRSLVKSISGDNVLKSRVGKSFLQQLISLEEELEIIYLIRTNFDLEDEAVVHDILLVVSEPGREVFVTETGRQFVDYLENKAGKAYIGNDNNKGIRMIPVIAALFLVAGISFGIAGKYIIDDIHYGNVAKELADSVGGGHSEDLNIRESANNPGQDILAGMEPGKRASLILDGNAGILEEYEELASKNADMAGWLTVEGTDINYPVLHRSDNSFYLDHNFYGEHDRNGSLFIDRYCSIFPQSENIIIYGHNVDNAPSFGQIKFFKDKPFRNYHPYITFNTIYEKGKYEIVSVFTTSVEKQGFQYYLFYGYDNEEQFNEFADYIMANAEYDTGVECHYGDKFLTLSTCDNSVSDGRFVVVAKKVE